MDIYHVLNRGVDKRTIFDTQADHARFIHDLYEFNDTAPAPDAYRRPMWDFVSPTLREERKMLVDIHGWCLMKNHYHLLLSEKREGGLTLFVRKLNIGYSKYYNDIHKRTGTLFQGRTKKILIHQDAHFLHILHYIHLNPLDFLADTKEWRNGQIASKAKALDFLSQYRWSSLHDYQGKRNFPSILTKHFFEGAYGGVARQLLSRLDDMDLIGIGERLE